MNNLGAFFRSTIGRKVVMAVSGVILVGFVVAHMLGNLQVYLGPGKLDEYGAALRRVPALLWAARAVLLVSVVAHIGSAWSLTRESWAARPVEYRRRQNAESTYASRLMRWGGVTLLLFVVYHILHFTTGTLHPAFVEGGVHHNFVAGLRVWPVAAFYMLATISLGLHLYHGTWSMLQTLGANHPRYNALRYGLAAAVAALVTLGNLSFPIAVLTGFVK